MKGYFISISKQSDHVWLLEINYEIAEGIPYKLSGTWDSSKLSVIEQGILLISTPGYPLIIQHQDNEFFRKFCETSKISCNGWLQDRESPYTVTRYKNDRMFLLLAETDNLKPVNVKEQHIIRCLKRRGIDYNTVQVHRS
jgi:hypothetical protein